MQGEESDNLSNLIAARIRISGMLHSAAATPSRPSTPVLASSKKKFSFGLESNSDEGPLNDACVAYSAGAKFGSAAGAAEKAGLASSTVNWNGGDTDFQVKYRNWLLYSSHLKIRHDLLFFS